MTSTQEKLHKLRIFFMFAKKIIRDDGLKYFIQLTIEEFQRNRLKIFESNVVDKLESYDLSHSMYYKKWLNQKFSSLMTKPLIQNSNNLELYIIIDEKKFSRTDLKKTISSLENQDNDKWKLIIITKKEINLNIENNKIIFKILKNLTALNNFIISSKSELISFLELGDMLHPNAISQFLLLFESRKNIDILYSDSDELNKKNIQHNPFFKPDWSPYLLLSFDYIGFFIMKRSIFEKINGFKKTVSENGVYDLLLRGTEIMEQIHHISLPLISTNHYNNLKKKSSIIIVQDALNRRKIKGKSMNGLLRGTTRVNFYLEKNPKISILIPTKDSKILLKRCIKSLEDNTDYKNWELIIIDNNSKKTETISYLQSLPYKVLSFNENYNFSKINNLASKYASGEFLLFLNDDVKAMDSNWLTELLAICSQPDVAIVGPKLVYRNNSIQSAGSIFLKSGVSFHPYSHKHSMYSKNYGLANVIRDYSSITGACMIMKKTVFDNVGGFDENFDVYCNDSDICLKSRNLGFKIVYTPFAKLLHDGSSTIKKDSDFFLAVENYCMFIKKHPYLKKGDPYYNPNLDSNYQLPSYLTNVTDLKKDFTS